MLLGFLIILLEVIALLSGHELIFFVDFFNELSFASSFNVTAILHPSTYLNKILVASKEGGLQLWNIRSMYFYFPYSPPFYLFL